MEQKAVTCDLQEQPKLICLWLDALLSRADRCRLAFLKLWLNCTQQRGYLMTGAILTMSMRSVQTAALAWCRPLKTSTDCGEFFTEAKYVRLERKDSVVKSERTAVVNMLCLRGTPGVEWGRGSARVPQLRIFKESAKEVSAGRHATTLRAKPLRSPLQRGNSGGASQLALTTASTTMLDQNAVFCDPEKRGIITTWLIAGTRAKSSRDRQLQRKQPFVSGELRWWHHGRL